LQSLKRSTGGRRRISFYHRFRGWEGGELITAILLYGIFSTPSGPGSTLVLVISAGPEMPLGHCCKRHPETGKICATYIYRGLLLWKPYFFLPLHDHPDPGSCPSFGIFGQFFFGGVDHVVILLSQRCNLVPDNACEANACVTNRTHWTSEASSVSVIKREESVRAAN